MELSHQKQTALHATLTRYLEERQADPRDPIFDESVEVAFQSPGVATVFWRSGIRAIDYHADGSGGFTLIDNARKDL